VIIATQLTSRKPPAPGVSPCGRRDAAGEAIVILLVDDDPDCRLHIRDAIAESKITNRVFEVANGQEALDFLHRRGSFTDAPQPGLIYMDLEMPGMDGQEALRLIRADSTFRDIP